MNVEAVACGNTKASSLAGCIEGNAVMLPQLLAVLVDADSSIVIGASQQAAERFGDLEGKVLFSSIRFANPETLQEQVSGEDGRVANSVVYAGDELLVAGIRVQHLAQHGRRFALLVFEDETECFGIKAALDAADHASLVIDPRGRVLAFNRPATGLFSGLMVGIHARELLGPDHEAAWWEPGAGGRRKMHLTLPPRIYQVTCSAVLLPGSDERLIVIALLPIARAPVEGQPSTSTTLVMSGLARTR